MSKVTFPALAIAGAGFFLCRLWAERKVSSALQNIAVALVPFAVLVGPFYFKNIDKIISSTRYLSSADVATHYGLGGALALGPAARFVGSMLTHYEFLMCFIGFIIGGIAATTLGKRARLGYALVALSFLLPFVVVALSNFKLERYAYPGYIGLFVLAGCGFAWVLHMRRLHLGAAIVGVALIFSFFKAAYTNALVPASWHPSDYTARLQRLGMGLIAVHAERPDQRDWQIAQLVAAVGARAEPIYIIGGTARFHMNLLRFNSMTLGYDQAWSGFLYQQHPVMRDGIIFEDIEAQKASVLYKSKPYDPEFLGLKVDETYGLLAADDHFVRRDLNVRQPDGSTFVFFERRRDVERVQ